ncbi:hypothetical protein Pelo_17979 [Pelomyxa schiedti]|nr:hypothetical protein Pelo_17979 [Pelomyxa schiedti]
MYTTINVGTVLTRGFTATTDSAGGSCITGITTTAAVPPPVLRPLWSLLSSKGTCMASPIIIVNWERYTKYMIGGRGSPASAKQHSGIFVHIMMQQILIRERKDRCVTRTISTAGVMTMCTKVNTPCLKPRFGMKQITSLPLVNLFIGLKRLLPSSFFLI